jgi:hypothetical protein
MGSGFWILWQLWYFLIFESIKVRCSYENLVSSYTAFNCSIADSSTNAEPEPYPKEAQGFEPNPMPGPTICSLRPIPEDMELKLINDDTQLLATSQEHEEHFMLTGGGSGCAGQDGMGYHLFCSDVAFFSS